MMEINFYSLFVSLGILLGFSYFFFYMWRKKMPGLSFFFLIALLAIPWSLLGARLWTYLFSSELQTTIDNLTSWKLKFEHFFGLDGQGLGGLSFHGALFFGFFYFYFYLLWYRKTYQVSLLYGFDILVRTTLIIQIVGRWGNFFNQELLGDIITNNYPQEYGWIPQWFADKLHLSNGQETNAIVRHPLFFYEILGNCLILFLLIGVIPKIGLVINYRKISTHPLFLKNYKSFNEQWNHLVWWKKPYYYFYYLFFINSFWKKNLYNLPLSRKNLPLPRVSNNKFFPSKFFPFYPQEIYHQAQSKINLLEKNIFTKKFFSFLLWTQRDCRELTNHFNPLKLASTRLGVGCYFYFLAYGILRLILQPYRDFPTNTNQIMPITVPISIGLIILGSLGMIINQFVLPYKWRKAGYLYETWYDGG